MALLPGRLFAGQTDPLALVDPELRPLTSAILKAQASGATFKQPTDVPLPKGVTQRRVPSRGSAPPVMVYVVNARADGPVRGAILHMHGGGFVGGSAASGVRALKGLAEALDCVIVTVDYRLAPATRFPGALEDNYAALTWLHDDAASLGVDPARIALLGESAGGGHAAMLAIAARDRGVIRIAAQALVYPMLDDRTGSSVTPPPQVGQLIWTAKSNREGWEALLGQIAGGRRVPDGAVPAREADLARSAADVHRGGHARPVRRRGHRLCPSPHRRRRTHRTARRAGRLSRFRDNRALGRRLEAIYSRAAWGLGACACPHRLTNGRRM